MISNNDIKEAYARISPFIRKTPIIESDFLNDHLDHKILFKAESNQITGAFKIRGVLNAIYKLHEKKSLPNKIVAYSSGNHAQAVAWVAKHFDIKAKLFMPASSAGIKMQIVRDLGAELIVTDTRIEAELKSKETGAKPGNIFLHPSDNDDVIAGAASLCYESLLDLEKENNMPDAIFAACGGGALISGTYLATKLFKKKIQVFAVEPKIANDAARSVKKGFRVGYIESPKTIADGVRTLKVSARTFEYLKKLDGIIEVSESDIMYWTSWLMHLLKINCEPTAALAMAGAFKWLKSQSSPKKILVVLSGGNADQESLKLIWQKDRLKKIPKI